MKIRHLFENSIDPVLEQYNAELDEHLEAGEILKPVFDALKNRISRFLERKHEELVRKPHLWGKGAEHDKIADKAIHDLTWVVVSSARDVMSLKSKLAKIKTPSTLQHPAVHAISEFVKQYAPLAEKLDQLKDKVVKTTEKRTAVKLAAAAVLKQKVADSSSLIRVLESHLEEYKKEAGNQAAAQVQYWLSVMEKADWDLNLVAPRPHTGMGAQAYKTANAKRSVFERITSPAPAARNLRIKRGDSEPRVRNVEAELRYIKDNIDAAEASYREYVHKMVEKIGKPVVDATLTGNPWTGSTLVVTTSDGENQTWRTQMIINRSKYDRLFNQFPSRQLK